MSIRKLIRRDDEHDAARRVVDKTSHPAVTLAAKRCHHYPKCGCTEPAGEFCCEIVRS